MNRACSEVGCDRPHHGRGLCKQHYVRNERARARDELVARTAPDLPSGVRIVAFGLDSLYLSGTHELRPGLLEELRALRDQAKEIDDPTAWPRWCVDDRLELVVAPHVPKFADVLLQSEAMTVILAHGKNRPTIRIELRAIALWQLGAARAIEMAQLVTQACAIEKAPLRVSRVDVCADFVGWDVRPSLCDEFITRARKRDEYHGWRGWEDVPARPDTVHRVGSDFTGFSWGMGGVVVGRLYNKSIEIRDVSQKTWMHDVWRQAGHDAGEDKSSVWRMEFQIRRAALREMHSEDRTLEEINDVDDLVNHIRGLWGYLTHNWLSHRMERLEDDRRTYTPEWRTLQGAPSVWGEDGTNANLCRSKRDAADGWNAAVFAGFLSRLAALSERERAKETFVFTRPDGSVVPLPGPLVDAVLHTIEFAAARGDTIEQKTKRKLAQWERARRALEDRCARTPDDLEKTSSRRSSLDGRPMP